MIDIALLRDAASRAKVIDNLGKRGVDATNILKLAELDQTWRTLSEQVERLRAKKNETNEQIKSATHEERASLIESMKDVATEEKELAEQLENVQQERDLAWRSIPNLIQDDVPQGGEDDFEVIAESSVSPREDTPKEYLALLGAHIDLERGAKVSGSRFVYITGPLARLELALASFIMDQLSEHHFTPVLPPLLVGEQAMAGMGYLDHDRDEVYRIAQDELYLVGTSEQAIGPMHMDEVLTSQTLPLRYVGFSPCFRREAGSHGKDVRGILRLHQFDKVEMFSFTTPTQSNEEHEFFLERQRALMDALELPYRVIKLAAGDLGGPSSKTYDIETWIPSEKRYRETHSASNTTDYQARRLNIRVRLEDGSLGKAHMLNGTAVAMSRIFIALIENHQQSDGSIEIPTALHSYLPFTTIEQAL